MMSHVETRSYKTSCNIRLCVKKKICFETGKSLVRSAAANFGVMNTNYTGKMRVAYIQFNCT